MEVTKAWKTMNRAPLHLGMGAAGAQDEAV